MIASSEEDAKEIILSAYDERPVSIGWRFIEERPDDWAPWASPGSRFQRAAWMQWPSEVLQPDEHGDILVSYPSDDGVDDDSGAVQHLWFLRDSQGDFYVSVGDPSKPGWVSVRLCGGSGGGAADTRPEFYQGIAIAAAALAGDFERVRRIAAGLVNSKDTQE